MCTLIKLNFLFCKSKPLFDALSNVYQTDVWFVRCILCHNRCKDSTQWRPELSIILRRAKPPPKNIQKDVFNALIALKKDPDRLVLSADKGNCVVVMDKHQYHDKALPLLNDKSPYAVLNSDLSSKTQRIILMAHLIYLKKWITEIFLFSH